MQQPTGVAIVATHLACTDRRALSQAWYSALHLAAPAAPRSRALAPETARAAAACQPEQHAAQGAAAAASPTVARRLPGAAGGGAPPAPERRCAKSEFARRLERALVRRTPREAARSFTLRAAGGRVHVTVRGEGARVRVVAVCSPSLRERVERALAQARFAVAGTGGSLELVR